ncbi:MULTISPECIES: TRAP transporter substrate-binding protein DctP [Thalassospira]|jgi:TRAP-type mannitol/chloroaromatic compound transport system substrate-binding protein|uniref:TRAP transporter substrate-binding protein n=1 Tax=Thalassospira TaxID=168934 RepID=UPI001B1663B1|nr:MULTISPECIES: TRAP transporter substrate-binding protein DctP [Thalassospira]MBO6806916.1 TRAP transporter substrate-binding protein DctP [Thalassospira sp.]MBO6842495.1 TRAP transporter substrate-binding protein DctP [Thalassospira sp.]
MTNIKRRDFLTKSAIGAAATGAGVIAAPNIVRAQETFNWKMTNAYGPGSPFYVTGPGSPEDFCKRVTEMSNGRLNIQHFAAGELIPALEGFDAVQAGTVEMNAANAYFWAGKIFAAQYFTTVPFGLNFQGVNAWLYHGGGLELWHEVYKPYGLVAFPMGNTGVQMTGWFREPIESLDDFNGLKMRIPGLAGKVYQQIGVEVKLLPGGEIFPALERGVIDAAEFVGPYQDRRLGLQKAAKYYYTTGWHEPSNVTELLINQQAWESLPADLQAIVKNAAQACNLDSHSWCEANNAAALRDLVENFGVTAQTLPDDVVTKLKDITAETLEAEAAKDPITKKVHDSFMAFRDTHREWAAISEKPYHGIISSKGGMS